MISTYPLTVDVFDNNGIPVAGAQVRVQLTQYDLAPGRVVVPARPHVDLTDENGETTISLWPNTQGVRGSEYRVWIYESGGQPLLDARFDMPAAPALLSDLLDESV